MKPAETLLPAIAYADALGLPYETRTRESMADVSLDQLAAVDGHKFFPEAPVGTWSDDTQQSMAVAMSLAELGEFDAEDMAKRLMAEYHVTSAGWGGGAIAVMQSLEQGATLVEASPPREHEGGCGAIMRMAPLVWWQHAKGIGQIESNQQIEALTRITHNNDEAVARTLEHGHMLRALLSGRLEPKQVHESLPEDSYVRQTLAVLQELEDAPEAYHNMLFSNLANSDKPFSGTDVMLMTYAAFQQESSYYSGLQRVIRLGGDTDSTAAIFAGLSVAAHGTPEQWPPADGHKLIRELELGRVAQQFAAEIGEK